MADKYFIVDVGVNVGGVSIDALNSNVQSNGSITVGNVTVYAANGIITSNGNIRSTDALNAGRVTIYGANGAITSNGNVTTTDAITVGRVSLYAANGNITSNGSITTTGNMFINTTQFSYSANSVPQKSYVDVISVTFGV